MVFTIIKLVEGITTVKDWYGSNVADTTTASELFNQFASGEMDASEPFEVTSAFSDENLDINFVWPYLYFNYVHVH